VLHNCARYVYIHLVWCLVQISYHQELHTIALPVEKGFMLETNILKTKMASIDIMNVFMV
jgi:hypothetical protein